MALTKATKATVYAIASTASNSITVGSALDVSTYYGGTIRIRMGRGTGTAFTTAPDIHLQYSEMASPDTDSWSTLAQFTPAVGASIGSQAVSGTASATATSVTLAAGTNFASGDFIFFHNGTIGNSEWKRFLTVSAAVLTLSEGLLNAQTGSTVRDQAEEYVVSLDLTSIQQLRVVVNGFGTGQAVIVQADGGFVSAL